MRKLAVIAAAVVAASLAHAGRAEAAQCGLPDVQPLHVEFSDGSVPFRGEIFRRPGLVLASNGISDERWLRQGGAQTIYWVMHLERLVGTPTVPGDPNKVAASADTIFDNAVAASGCATPWIALNEFLGPTLKPPYTSQNTQYRANVLALLKELAARGGRPFLLSPSDPFTGGEVAAYWQQVAAAADVVREQYFTAAKIVAQGPLLGSRALRVRLRKAVASLTSIAIPPARVGLMLGFETTGIYGRAGLQPLAAWLEFVKLDTLAARQVAKETGISTVWSWGWGVFGEPRDPDAPTAACVYLWTRDPSLCDAPARAGADLDTSLTEGQILLARGVQCSLPSGRIATASIDQATRLTHDRAVAFTALFARVVQRAAKPVAPAAVAAAERKVIRTRFGGVRRRYLRALARRRVTLAFARATLADELRRPQIVDVAAWTVAEQTKELDQATCLADDLPLPGDVRLGDALPFLKLAA